MMLGILGQGYVGTAVRETLCNYFPVLTYDVKFEDMVVYENGGKSYWIRKEFPIKEIVKECSLIFVCVPTPMNSDGSCNISIVEQVITDISRESFIQRKCSNVVIKSTVPPGTTDKLNLLPSVNVCFYPEFLREATAHDDFKNQNYIIVGGDCVCMDVFCDVCSSCFPWASIYKTNAKTAELVKYIINCFLATKVSFANEIKQICDALKIDYDDTIKYAQLDKRIGESHWQVPGPMPADDGTGRLLPGFSGSCFIKDLNALIDIAFSLEVNPTVLQAAWQKNIEVRPERDWENLVGRAVTERTKNEQKELIC